ncbi:hypothetical protein GYA49_03340 [Candidatus Beckwithbacteria bacterium]|nr:hypothetical protein [Candidatus Beckwithbacteria bacterium]
MNLLVYSFKTFPYKKEIEDIFPSIFYFYKLTKDIETFKQLIIQNKPDYVVGIAFKKYGQSCFEPQTVNIFNKKAKITRNGIDSYNLFIPTYLNFKTSNYQSRSFCNWTMYKVSEFINWQHLATKLIFTHISRKDIIHLRKFYENCFSL